MKKRLFAALLLLSMTLTTLCACSTGGAGSGAGSGAGGGDTRICFLAQANNTFQASLRDAITAKSEELGIKVDTFNADNDVSTQLDQIESAVASGYDAIILCAVDSAGVLPGAQTIKDAGIPLVCVNMLVDDENAYDVYVGSDDVDAGTIQGEWVKEQTGGSCKIGLLYVPIGCSAEVGRTKGLKQSLLDVCPDAVVVAEDDGKAQIDEGMRITEDWMQTYPDIDIIVAQNDAMGLGAMQAVLSAGKKDDILICGVDGDQDAVQAIIDGTYDMTVFQNAAGQGSMAVEVALGLIGGETYDKSVMIPFEAITAENAADYLE